MHCFRVALGGVCLAALIGCGQAVAPQAVHRMGERVPSGSLVYNVFDNQWKTQLGDGPQTRIPKDRFLLVRLSITNGGTQELIVPNLSLVDDSGETYTELSDGSQVPSWIGFLRRVRPAESVQGNIVFDVAPKHYELRVSDENDQKTAAIDLPLNFTSETPAIPGPAQ
jgi:hypothetical protein